MRPGATSLQEEGASEGGGEATAVALLGGDLMAVSRLEGPVRLGGGRLRVLGPNQELVDARLLLVDLSRDPEAQLVRMSELLKGRPQARAICFGPHLEMGRLQPLAKAAGASRCLANSALQDRLPELVAERLGGPAGERR